MSNYTYRGEGIFKRILNERNCLVRNVPYKQYHCLSFPSAHNSSPSLLYPWPFFITCLSEKILLFLSLFAHISPSISFGLEAMMSRVSFKMQFHYCHLYSKQAGLIIRLSRRLKDSSLALAAAANGVTSSHLDDHELHKSTGTRHGKLCLVYRCTPEKRPHEINLL